MFQKKGVLSADVQFSGSLTVVTTLELSAKFIYLEEIPKIWKAQLYGSQQDPGILGYHTTSSRRQICLNMLSTIDINS